jgi:pyruvate/2-oxoglutarate dehydrogenase complex dihydrolipoamide acyltransferase (E2) component
MCNRWQNMQSVEGGQYLVEVEDKVEVPVSKPQSGLITKSVKDKLIL